MARPKKIISRDRQLNLSLTSAELELIRSRAARAGMLVPDYSRARLLADWRVRARQVTAPSLFDQLAFEQLKRLGNNLNQIARYMNTHDEPVPPILEALLLDIRVAIDRGMQQHDR